ncbi:MAG: ATP-binding protein [Muribaculaceae bacterium]|nr:ATP-binding protein [Muribaculaceae bacterium]
MSRGREIDIKAFEFQRQNRPSRLQCFVKGIDESGEPVYMQDIAAIIPQIYTVGNTYEFRVKTDLNSAGYYDVADWNGLMFRLYPGRRHDKLHINQVVKCRVKDINLVRMDLELVSGKERGIPLYSIEQVLELDSTDHGDERLLRRLFGMIPEFGEAREQLEAGNPLWVITVADVVSRHLSDWLNATTDDGVLRPLGRKRIIRIAPLLKSFNSICTNLLENSGYLRDCTPQERVEYQDRLNKIITHTTDYVSALEKIIDRKEQVFIDETLERLKLSGYLYKPEERMRVAMAIFSLRKKSVSQYIDDIFDIIRLSHSNPRFMHLFSKAFVEMLDMYIANESRHIDLLTGPTERTAIQQMVKALSLRLLLPGDETDSQRALYRSKLYRYVTLLATVNADQLVSKALSTLFNISSPLEFTWNDLSDINLLCSKVAVSKSTALSQETMLFEGNNAMMSLSGDSFTFTPVERGQSMKLGVPSDLFGERRIRVLLNERMQEKLKASRQDIMQFHHLWREVEKSLFSPRQNTRQTIEGITPDVGDRVKIVILGSIPGHRYDFKVRIEDEAYTGEGIITPKQIVSYPIIPTADSFSDPETGRLCIYEAEVMERDETTGELTFNMRDLIHQYLQEALAIDDEWLVQVSRVDPDRYLCISEGGFSLYINRDEADLSQGDFIIARIDTIFPYAAIKGSYVEHSDETFQQTNAFKCLLENYCDHNLLDTEEEDEEEINVSDDDIDEARSAQNFIDPVQMRELIHLIDREGMLRNDHIQTYNYLAIARIMARLLGDSQLVTYFSNRMELVETIRLFGDSGKIDEDRLNKLLNDNKDFIATYPDIETRLTHLRIINELDKSYKSDWLWEIARNHPDETTSHLARLVLSYNMLEHSNVFEVRRTLHRKIYQLMQLKVQLPESMQVAEEDQFTELKTSIIYPAGNQMFPNEREQITEILRVISSFLNTRGGRLYVGVADTGYAVGLHNDFTYLNNRHENYDLSTVKDKFDRLVRDAVHNRLGRIANSKISTDFELVGNVWIYRVDVDPSPEVALVDGVAYERQGKSKWPIPSADLSTFREQREREFRN